MTTITGVPNVHTLTGPTHHKVVAGTGEEASPVVPGFGITDGTTSVTIDPYAAAVPVIDVAHNQTHLGNMYTAGYRWTAQADNATLYMSIAVPSGYVAHFIYEVVATGKAYIDLYEGATVSGGTSITPANKNRMSANTSHVTIKHDVTVSDAGTLIPQDGLIGGGDKHTAIGGGAGLDAEFILKQNTTYLIAIQNKGGAAQDLAAVVLFYEKSLS